MKAEQDKENKGIGRKFGWNESYLEICHLRKLRHNI
jgi:hypothetical protein